MSTLDRKRIRLIADQATKTDDKMVDVYTDSTPELWVGNDVQFEVGIYHNNSLVTDISNIASLTLEVKNTSDRDGDPVMTATVSSGDLDGAVTQDTWDDKTAQHALVTFTGSETNLTVGSDNQAEYWLVISVITNDTPGRNITLQATTIKVVEDGTGSAGQPQNNANIYYTKDESDARFAQLHADQAWMQFENGVWYIYEATTDKWYPLKCTIVDTVPTLTLGDGVSDP